MNRPVFSVTVLASMLALAVSTPAPAKDDPASLAQRDLAAERRVEAKNRFEGSGVDRVIVWCIYETKGDKIAVVTLVGQRTDPQTARFIAWLQSQPSPR